MAPGANVSEVARRHQLLPQQLYNWRSKVSERIESNDTAFVPAIVQDAPRSVTHCVSPGAEIRIEFNGMSVFVPDGASADHVERVLLAVRVMS